jgi:hypothetical protein
MHPKPVMLYQETKKNLKVPRSLQITMIFAKNADYAGTCNQSTGDCALDAIINGREIETRMISTYKGL